MYVCICINICIYVCRWIFKPWLACIASGRKKPCTSIAWSPLVHIHTPTYIHTYLFNIKHIHTYIHTSGSVEQRIVQRAQKKLFLDSMVNRGSSAKVSYLVVYVCMYVCIVTTQTVCMYVCRGLKWMPSKPPRHPHRRSLSIPMETKPPRKSTPVRKPDLPFIHTYIHTYCTYIHTYIHTYTGLM